MYRAILMGLFLSACTDEPGVGVNRYHGDSKPVREHEIQTGPEALAVAGELVTLVREASTGTALRGVDGSARLGDGKPGAKANGGDDDGFPWQPAKHRAVLADQGGEHERDRQLDDEDGCTRAIGPVASAAA